MLQNRRLRAPIALLSLLLVASIARAEAPAKSRVEGVPRIKQLRNYCGPAALAAVIQSYGRQVTQESIGRAVYDDATGATNGADMLLYARENGFAAYSWNTSIEDVKRKIAAGIPVIALQQNSLTDTSGHYRVLTGYDDVESKFYIMDPYYDDITELSYSKCKRLWERMGYWALLVVPQEKDNFAVELGTDNPVVHMDLAYAQYKRRDYDSALKEAQTALSLEPRNAYALSMQNKIRDAMGAGKK